MKDDFTECVHLFPLHYLKVTSLTYQMGIQALTEPNHLLLERSLIPSIMFTEKTQMKK